MNPIKPLIDYAMIPFLEFSYNTFFPNYGVAIILLTIVIKVVFYPMTKKQFESMRLTQKLQPELKKIQEKYKGQPEKLHKEMMKLWKEHNANPLGGCLPALVQFPFLIAIFLTVKSERFLALLATEGSNAGLFSFWLADLGQPDSTMILPLVIAVTIYGSQKMMKTDPKQAAIMAVMPFIMFFVSMSLPAGVLLYWATSQVISLAQQYYIMNPPQGSVTIVKESSNV